MTSPFGCFVYVPPSDTEPAAARLFAPAIGVPEDVANIATRVGGTARVLTPSLPTPG
jgi:predicted PhzF superfamily epimerase YddE/YHI9